MWRLDGTVALPNRGDSDMAEWWIFGAIIFFGGIMSYGVIGYLSEIRGDLIEIKQRQKELHLLLEDKLNRAINMLDQIRYDVQPDPPPGSNDDPWGID